MSRKHKEWTDEERREAAARTHAENRLGKIDNIMLEHKNKIATLKIERKRLRAIIE